LHYAELFKKTESMKKTNLIVVVALFATACNNTNKNTGTNKISISDSSVNMAKPKDSLAVYTAEMLDSKKDLVCGMPASAGIADTAHYKGKVYGFCSKECKDEFVKAPSKYLTTK
jgi:YHS domain-containing protein